MKRIKTLCIILLVVFFGSLYQGAVLPFIEGIKYGLTLISYQTESNKETNDFIFMDVVVKNNNHMDTSEINLRTGESALTRPNNMTIIVESLPDKPIWWLALQAVYHLFSLITLALGLWIPFLVVKIVRSLQHSEVFDRMNLKRINRIGLILVGVGLLSTAVQGINILMAQSMVDLSNYSFTFSKAIDFNPIIMGVVILIMNEVLRIGIEIKEEQDLTI